MNSSLKVFIVAHDEKCGHCNWAVSNLYLIAETRDEALELYAENDRGLCGDCLAEMMADGNYEITMRSKDAPS